MAKNKRKVIVYADWSKNFEDLSDLELGQLMRHFFSYVNDENPVLSDRILKIAWKPIEVTLKRDLDKWEQSSSARSDKARKAGLASALKRKEQKEKSNSVVESSTKSTVSVSDSVSDSDSVSGIDRKKKEEKDYPIEVYQVFDVCVKFFEDNYKPKTDKAKSIWLDSIDKLHRIDGYSYRTIYDIAKRAKADPFWTKQVQSIYYLRKNNKNGIKYIVVFSEQFKIKPVTTKEQNEYWLYNWVSDTSTDKERRQKRGTAFSHWRNEAINGGEIAMCDLRKKNGYKVGYKIKNKK